MNTKFQLLAADIGATNSRFALFEAQLPNDSELKSNSFPNLYLRKEHWLETKDYNSFSSLLNSFRNFSQKNSFLPPKLACACIAVPGPIEENFCYPPNINWTINAAEVNKVLGLEHTFLINDFVAQGYACMLARSSQSRNKFDLESIWQPKISTQSLKIKPDPRQDYDSNTAPSVGSMGPNYPQKPNSTPNPNYKNSKTLNSHPVAILGAGSGLGKAIILEDLQLVLPSEGGHANFPFIGLEEFAYAEFLMRAYGIDEFENDLIVNGPGLARLYDYHSKQLGMGNASKNFPKPASLEFFAREVSTILGGNISQNPAAELTLEWYARFYGRVCKNFALDCMALGGVYITGGMASRVPVLQHPAFLQSFQQSHDQKWLLEKIPVFHIQSQQAGLRGAALFGVLQYFKTSVF